MKKRRQIFHSQVFFSLWTEGSFFFVRLGEPFSGVFSTSDNLWSHLDSAGKAEQDRFWRMPFDDFYMRQIDSSNADLCNTGGRTAGVSLTFYICLLEEEKKNACLEETVFRIGIVVLCLALVHSLVLRLSS
jgi:hypothetical protein